MFVKIKCMLLTLLLSMSSLFSLVISQPAEAVGINNNLGAGFGVPFGIFGVSYELEINVLDSFSIGPTVALGTTILSGGASEIGLQMHFGDRSDSLRFGLSYWSGTNTIIQTGFDEYTTEEGETAGVSLRLHLNRKQPSAIDFHLLKILAPKEDELIQRYDAVPEGGDIKIGIGFIRIF